jgi:hypothetical protein
MLQGRERPESSRKEEKKPEKPEKGEISRKN